MVNVIKVTEENKKLILRYFLKLDLRDFLEVLICIIVIISGFIYKNNYSIVLSEVYMVIFFGVVGCLLLFSLVYWQRGVNLTIDEEVITIEYPTHDKIIQKTFPNKNIKRVYTVNRGKDVRFFRSNCYELWMEDYQGEKIKILGKQEGFVVKKAKDIYEVLDKITPFLHKNHYLKPKKEVIQKISTPKVKVLRSINRKVFTPPRQITKEQDTAKLKIQDLREGVLFDFHNENWEVIDQVQYDWKLEKTDTLYQIKNQRNQISLLFVAQNMAVYTAWIEERVSQYELIEHQLDKVSQNLPVKFTFRESVFLKEHFDVGHEFASKSKNGVKIKQWKYLSEDRKESLRILEHEDKDTFVFWGEKIEEFEFSNILLS